MIGSSKNNRENYPRKCFWTQERETRVKFNSGLSANRPSNNWALVHVILGDVRTSPRPPLEASLAERLTPRILDLEVWGSSLARGVVS